MSILKTVVIVAAAYAASDARSSWHSKHPLMQDTTKPTCLSLSGNGFSPCPSITLDPASGPCTKGILANGRRVSYCLVGSELWSFDADTQVGVDLGTVEEHNITAAQR